MLDRTGPIEEVVVLPIGMDCRKAKKGSAADIRRNLGITDEDIREAQERLEHLSNKHIEDKQ